MEGAQDLVFAECARLASLGERGAVALVTQVRGSGPQVAGARLVLGPSGRFTGTIGGGAVEAAVLADAARVRDGEGGPRRCSYQLSADLGMCCGGTMELCLLPLSAGDAPFWRDLAEAEHGEGGLFALVQEGSHRVPAGALLWLHDDALLGCGGGLRRDPAPRSAGAAPATATGEAGADASSTDPAAEAQSLAAALAGAAPAGPSLLALRDTAGAPLSVYAEPLLAARRLVLFGGGHVAAPTAALARLLGYQVTVVDDRPEWASPARFPGCALVHAPYVDFLFGFEPRTSDTLIIVTRGHDFDQEVLAALVDKPSRYLGMIGSRAKVRRAFLRLRAAGVDEALLERVHAPVGLDLGAQTPAEIAVAIAAELVQERRGRPRPAGVPGWWRSPP